MKNFPEPFVWAEKHKSTSSNSGKKRPETPDFIGSLPNYPSKPVRKFVKKANMFVTTSFDKPQKGRGGRQVMTQQQSWTDK